MIEIIKKAVVSGILVGIGVVVNTLVVNNLTPNPYVGAMLFSLALLVIIKNQLPLYTGKIGFVGSVPFQQLIVMLFANFFGILCTVLSLSFIRKTDLLKPLQAIAAAKFSKSALALFILGFFCGVMMFVAVYSKDTVITVFCIMIFIFAGFEHCIADFPYLILDFSGVHLLKFLCIVIGNSIGSITIWFLVHDKQEA